MKNVLLAGIAALALSSTCIPAKAEQLNGPEFYGTMLFVVASCDFFKVDVPRVETIAAGLGFDSKTASKQEWSEALRVTNLLMGYQDRGCAAAWKGFGPGGPIPLITFR